MYLATDRAEEAEATAGEAREVLAGQLAGGPLAHCVGRERSGPRRWRDAERMPRRKKCCLSSYASLGGAPGSGSRAVYVAMTSNYLAEMYRAWGKPDEAQKLRTS